MKNCPSSQSQEAIEQGWIPQISASKLGNFSLKFTVSQNSINEKILLLQNKEEWFLHYLLFRVNLAPEASIH